MKARNLLRLTVFSCVSALAFAARASIAATTDLTLARKQFCEFYLGTSGGKSNATLTSTNEQVPDQDAARRYVDSLSPNGSWLDLDYSSQSRSGWPPSVHWTRILAIISASHSDLSAADRLRYDGAVHRAINYWIANDFSCPNWWYNKIGVPQQAATAAVLLGNSLKESEKRYLLGTLMPRSRIDMTGQNRVWLAGNTLMFALVGGDGQTVDEAANVLWSEVVVTTAEGIQPDFSFHQHGPQQQFGNYGLSFAVEITRWATALRNTKWSIPSQCLAAFRGFLLDGEAWVVWRGFFDVAACDRQLMPGRQRSKTVTLARVIQNTPQFDPAGASSYLGFSVRNEALDPVNDLVGNRAYWRSDYVIHRRPRFAATLKMSSRRTVGAEMVNSENQPGFYEGDGALYLYRRGDEYLDIFPVWDWQKLPGVTCAYRDDGPPAYTKSLRGERDFVGEVSDGENGCAVLDFERMGTGAHKAWYFGDNAIVCLGANIHAGGHDPVITTIDQRLLSGPVTVKCVGREPVAVVGNDRLRDVEWVEHDGWRYSFTTPAIAHLSVGPQTGNWRRVFDNPDTPRADIRLNVFALWISHEEVGDLYDYIVTPAGLPAVPGTLRNNDMAQAVQLSPGKSAIAFWKPGMCQIGDFHMSSDQPCLMLLNSATRRLFVSDPTQQLDTLTFVVNARSYKVSLPKGGNAGRSLVVELYQ